MGKIRPMVDPDIDDMDREWCYQIKGTTWIGTGFQPDWTQVTFDGALYNRQNCELCFFYGQDMKPIPARQRTYLEGWIPIVQSDWNEKSIYYTMEVFAFGLEGRDQGNTVNFVKFTLENRGTEPSRGFFTAAMRNCGEDKRWLQWVSAPDFSTDWVYEMTANTVLREGQIMFLFPEGGIREAVPGVGYTSPFSGEEYHVTSRSETCIIKYEKDLMPSDKYTMIFKMPRQPIEKEKEEFYSSVISADYFAYRNKVIDHWRKIISQGMEIDLPEDRVRNAFRAGQVHMLIAIRKGNPKDHFKRIFNDLFELDEDECIPSSGLNYPGFFSNDYVDTRMAYDFIGRKDLTELFYRSRLHKLFSDEEEEIVPHGHGQLMYSLAHHYIMTRDENYAREVFDKLSTAVKIADKAVSKDPYGLLPEMGPYDNEMIQGHYTSHNLWLVLGLRAGIRLARAIGEDATADEWLKFHDKLMENLKRAIKASASHDGYVPTGLYKIKTGPDARQGMPPQIFNNEWENGLLVWPTEVLDPYDHYVSGTLSKIHKLDYQEGVLAYRNMPDKINDANLHGYSGYTIIYQHIARREKRQALIDLYNMLLHCGSTHEIWEQGVYSWTNRDCTSTFTAPHAWAAARMLISIRNMLVMEQGGRAGLDEGQRDLHLFSVVSPAWAGKGKKISFSKAMTEMGEVSASMRFTDYGAEIRIDAGFHHRPGKIIIHIPYFVTLNRFSSDDPSATRHGDEIHLDPGSKQISLYWEMRPESVENTFLDLLLAYRKEPSVQIVNGEIVYIPAPEIPLSEEEKARPPQELSFGLVLQAYRHEYLRRYKDFIRNGGIPEHITSPQSMDDRSS